MKRLRNVFRKGFVGRVKNVIARRLKSEFLDKDYSHDEYFSLGAVQNGFSERKEDVKDPSIFERIIKAYNLAKIEQQKSPDIYQVGNDWLPIYEAHMSEIMAALSGGSIEKVAAIYNNFFREQCSVGLHGMPVDMFSHYFDREISEHDKKRYLNDFIHRLRLWKTTSGRSLSAEALKSPNIGNPYGLTIAGDFIRAGSDYLHHYASVISSLVRRGGTRKVVVELGGGFGGMPYYLIRDNHDITYVDFDLPENVALTAFYLLSAFPEKRIALYGEVDFENIDVAEYDCVLMPNFMISKMKPNSADLVFNSYSLAEMSAGAIENYVDNFNRIASRFVFHVNHVRDSLVKADDFKVDLRKFDLVYRAPALWNMARNSEMDEFEFLFKNTSMTFVSEL